MKTNFYSFLFLLSFTILFNLNAGAQCTPDSSISTTGVTPRSLADGKVGEPYSQVLQYYVVKDTLVSLPGLGDFNATIDSFSIVKITGYPAGLSYQCNTSNCSTPGGVNGCINVTGIPTEKGVFPLEIILKIRATENTFKITQTQYDTISSYVLTINGSVSTIENKKLQTFDCQIFPNPAKTELNLDIWNESAKKCDVQIVNLQGQIVLEETFDVKNGLNKNKLNIAHLAKGVYLLQINNETNQFHQKLIVE
jgi:hypothetical protein